MFIASVVVCAFWLSFNASRRVAVDPDAEARFYD
jgi:hypothetical protein